jgi:hypothetical protein
LSGHYFLDLATRLILRLPASSGTTSVRCTCRCISVSSFHGVSFKTLAPRAYITYYQARGLSGHTSPCGECACFSTPTPLMIKDATLQDTLMFTHRNPSRHTFQEGEIFSFLKSTIHSLDNLLLRQQRLQQLLGCRFDWSKTSSTQASLFEES